MKHLWLDWKLAGLLSPVVAIIAVGIWKAAPHLPQAFSNIRDSSFLDYIGFLVAVVIPFIAMALLYWLVEDTERMKKRGKGK